MGDYMLSTSVACIFSRGYGNVCYRLGYYSFVVLLLLLFKTVSGGVPLVVV